MTVVVVAILVGLIVVGGVVVLLDHVGGVETYTISTRDFPNIHAPVVDTAIPGDEQDGARAA